MRCRILVLDRIERFCKMYYLLNLNKYILNLVKFIFYIFLFEQFKVYLLRNYFSIFIFLFVSL